MALAASGCCHITAAVWGESDFVNESLLNKEKLTLGRYLVGEGDAGDFGAVMSSEFLLWEVWGPGSCLSRRACITGYPAGKAVAGPRLETGAAVRGGLFEGVRREEEGRRLLTWRGERKNDRSS